MLGGLTLTAEYHPGSQVAPLSKAIVKNYFEQSARMGLLGSHAVSLVRKLQYVLKQIAQSLISGAAQGYFFPMS